MGHLFLRLARALVKIAQGKTALGDPAAERQEDERVGERTRTVALRGYARSSDKGVMSSFAIMAVALHTSAAVSRATVPSGRAMPTDRASPTAALA